MRQMVRMRKAIEAMGTLMSADRGIEARASSSANLGLDTNGSPTTMVSTEEVNATPTSISTFAPEVIGSTAHAAIGGEYDGSNGTDTLTFKVDRDGTHGEDNLQLKVFDSNDDQIDQIDIDNQDPLGQQYTLSNGLVLSLGEGTLVKDDTFTVDVVAVPGSFSPSQPEWAAGSTDSITLGGVYDGSNGTDTLTFKVNHGGTHGVDNLQLKVFDANDNQIDQIDIHDNDPLDQQYTLSNGVVLALGEGELLADTFFTVEVFDGVGSAVDPSKPFDALRADNPNSYKWVVSNQRRRHRRFGRRYDQLRTRSDNPIIGRRNGDFRRRCRNNRAHSKNARADARHYTWKRFFRISGRHETRRRVQHPGRRTGD
jgi:hypothetical protein